MMATAGHTSGLQSVSSRRRGSALTKWRLSGFRAVGPLALSRCRRFKGL